MLVRLTVTAMAVSGQAVVWRHADVSRVLDTLSSWSGRMPRLGVRGLRCAVTGLLTGLDGLVRSVSPHSSGG